MRRLTSADHRRQAVFAGDDRCVRHRATDIGNGRFNFAKHRTPAWGGHRADENFAVTNLADEWKPSPNGGGAGLEVDDFNAAIAELKKAGVKFLWEAQDTPVCHMALVSDPDGNSIDFIEVTQ